MQIHVLRSPTGGSRRSRAASDLLMHDLRHHGNELVDLTGTSAAETSHQLRDAIADGGVERVLIAGGDGLVNLAVQELAETSIAAAIAPVGSGNDFASALGIKEPLAAAALAKPTAVDLIRVGGEDSPTRWVASIAIAGFPAAINARANQLPLPLGSHIYTVAVALELPRFTRVTATLRLDGAPLEIDSGMLAIGNTRLFGGGMLACPDARPDDGLLNLTSIEGVGRVGILRHLLGRAGGTADRVEVIRQTASQIDLETVGVEVWGDGEPVGVGPLRFTVVPGALLVAGADLT